MEGFWVKTMGLSEYINVNIACQMNSEDTCSQDEALILRCGHQ